MRLGLSLGVLTGLQLAAAFRDLPANTVAILPVASIEQHGPHLPVAVDTVIGNGVTVGCNAVIHACEVRDGCIVDHDARVQPLREERSVGG